MNKKIDALDILPEEACRKCDEAVYRYLSDNGIDTENAATDTAKRDEIRKELSKRQWTLMHTDFIDRDKNEIAIVFQIKQGKNAVAEPMRVVFRGNDKG